MNILFVCTANISRSFMSERLLKHKIIKHQLEGIAVKSAGVMALSDSPPDPKMVDYLDSLGISSSDKHQSRQLDKEIVEWADHIFVMEINHHDRIESAFPEAKHKLELLGKYISSDGSEDDIVDPFGRSPFHYRLSQSQIQMAVEGVFNKFCLERFGF